MGSGRSSSGNERVRFDPAHVRFVLVEPLAGGNAGSAARALKNLGFSRLVLVRPHFDAGDRQARTMAVGAADLLARAEVHAELDTALAGARTVVGTSGRTGKQRRPHHRLDRFSAELARLATAGEVAVIFGREDRGMTDRELDRCTHLVYLPAADDYPSFNLAQAVLLVAYELRRALVRSSPDEPVDPPAEYEEREQMYAHLAHALLAIGFLKDDAAESMMRRLRRMLGRAGLTAEDVTILRGIARQTLWAAHQAGLESAAASEQDGRDGS